MGAVRAAVLIAVLCATAQLGSASRPAKFAVDDFSSTEVSLRQLQVLYKAPERSSSLRKGGPLTDF